MSDNLMQTYARLPVSFVRGQGALVWDSDGKEYIDALGGIAVCGLGHAHQEIADTLYEQAKTLVHTSNVYGIQAQSELAERLTSLAGMDRAFFCNSGAEANEGAIKIARLHGNKQGIEAPAIIVMEHSFHGRTLATLSATGNRKVHAGFEPLVQGFVRVGFNDIEGVEAIAANTSNVVAILVEPVQGEGGVQVPNEGYLQGLRAICDQNNWLLMLDEIQTGIGRTGKFLAYQHTAIKPDVVTVAKALGNGVPIGAFLARGKAADLMQPGNHGSTFGGNPLACRVGLKVLEILERDKLAERAARLGEHLRARLSEALAANDKVTAVRGAGLMVGIELSGPCQDLVRQALDRGLLINVTAERVIRLLPPLVIEDEQLDQAIEILLDLIQNFTN